MKHSALSILFIFLTQFLYGQEINGTVISKKYIDNLKKEIADLRDRNNNLYWRNRLTSDVVKIDTVFIRADSVDINNYVKSQIDDSLILVMTKSVSNYSKNVVTDYIERYYDNKKLLRYIENWFVIDDGKFEAKLWRKERIEYDNLDRTALRVTYLQSERRTIKIKIWYDNMGTAYSSTESIKGYAMERLVCCKRRFYASLAEVLIMSSDAPFSSISAKEFYVTAVITMNFLL